MDTKEENTVLQEKINQGCLYGFEGVKKTGKGKDNG